MTNWFGRHWVISLFLGLFLLFVMNSFFVDMNSESNNLPIVAENEPPQNTPSSGNEILTSENISGEEVTPLSYDNYPDAKGLHWGHMPITYYIKNQNVCGSKIVEQINQAFRAIENETDGIVDFEFNFGEGDISLECFDRYNDSVASLAMGNTYADATPWVFDDGVGNVVSAGQIRLFKVTTGNYYGRCKTYPDTIIHEILHLFGFVDTGKGIMNRYIGSCLQKIDREVIDKLKETYSI